MSAAANVLGPEPQSGLMTHKQGARTHADDGHECHGCLIADVIDGAGYIQSAGIIRSGGMMTFATVSLMY